MRNHKRWKRALELQLGRRLLDTEYDRVANRMHDLQSLTEALKEAKDDPSEYDLLVWRVILLSDAIVLNLA